MTRVRFILKLLIAMLGPAAVAFALLLVWIRVFQKPVYPDYPTFSDQFFGLLFYGLLFLSILLPILLVIREIQNKRSIEGPPSPLAAINTPTDTLWK